MPVGKPATEAKPTVLRVGGREIEYYDLTKTAQLQGRGRTDQPRPERQIDEAQAGFLAWWETVKKYFGG